MGNAYGFVEITGVVAAMDAVDIMGKAADVPSGVLGEEAGRETCDPDY